MSNPVTIATIFEEAAALVAAHWPVLLGIIAATTGYYSFADIQADISLGNSLYMGGGFVMLYLQLFVIVRMARTRGLLAGRSHENGSPTLGLFIRAFGQSIVFTVGIAVGLVLLVVPGVWLVTVWFVALPAMLVENETILDSLGRSKRLVTPHFWPVLAIVAMIVAAFIGSGVLFAYFVPTLSINSVAPIVGVNLFAEATLVAGWVLSLATYIGLRSQESGGPIEEIFA